MTVDDNGDNVAVPVDYEIRVVGPGADTSNSLSPRNRLPTNFEVWDVTNLNSPRRVPFQMVETPLVPGDSVRGELSPGDVINVRFNGVDLAGYTFFAQSAWRFNFDLTQASTDIVTEGTQEANLLYDSLAVKSVRGLENLPYGNDLSIDEVLPFYQEIDVWYSTILDSLVNIPGLQDVVRDAKMPSTWLAEFDGVLRTEKPAVGDVFLLETTKPFDRDDVIRFKVEGNELDDTLDESVLDNIYVVPDPYVAVNSLESRNLLLSGRGERRIDFRNLPQQCTIRIYTMSGRQVKVIDHVSSQEESIATWNLQTDDGLDVSYGVYIYHVDAPGIGKKIGRFAIIK